MSVADLEPAAREADVRDYWALLKPRVMSLVVFTAVVGMLAAPTQAHPVISVAALLCVALGAGASGALNMWWDADIDARMDRTRGRPVPSGVVSADDALHFGLWLSILAVTLLTLISGPLAGALLAGVIAFYVVVYTMWLKRRTAQNIVIGGLAGAAPPMLGWVIATGELALEPALLVAIIFLWTPPHSWALALFRRDDYARVGVPMLPVAAGDAATRRAIWLYALLLAPVAVAPAATQIAGPLYALASIGFGVELLRRARVLARRSAETAAADGLREEKRFFGFTILYLFALFLALLVEAALRAVGLGVGF